jgi:hypothetical protein
MKTIIVLVSFLSCMSLPAEAAPVCPHDLFSCLQQHTDDFYLADHDRFYQVYDQAFAKAMQCKDYQDVANYLTIYSSSQDNAEVDESIQQDSEALLLLKPKCFFEGYLRLAPEQQENVLGNYHLFSRPNHVMTLLHKYMQGGKYKNIAAALYNANLEAYLSYGKGAEDAPMDDLYQQYKQRESK